jgi:hypothetical protein
MTDYSELVKRLRGEYGTEPWQINPAAKIAADAIEAQAKRIEELETEKQFILIENERRWEECIPKFHKMEQRTKELEHQLRVECDTYLWKRKLMSRRIAMLEYWMEKLFKYGSSPEARRNQMTMTTEIPDYLMREGEDILLQTPASENGDE